MVSPTEPDFPPSHAAEMQHDIEKAANQDCMSKLEALMTSAFGVILPTVDVFSDFWLGLTMLTQREWVCLGYRISGEEIHMDDK